MLADDLLDTVRRAAGRDDLGYIELPERLGGGFFTENHAFRLSGAPPPWDGPLVVRLFPSNAPPDLAHREACVQRVLADQGYPAPRVLLFDGEARLVGRRFFVMERLPGRPMLGGIRVRELLGSARGLLRRLVNTTASAQAWLHRLDAAPLLEHLADTTPGVERWFELLGAQPELGWDGLSDGLEWLVANRPAAASRPSICHGDLWAGNILTDGDRLTGVLDYTVATIAEPALDVGFTAMSFDIAPVDVPAPVQRLAAGVARSIGKRYVESYARETGADLSNQRYYEALRCATELTGVVSYRMARANGETLDTPRPTWDSVSDQMITYFRERTGVSLRLPDAIA